MSARSVADRERLDAAVRALCQIECIASAVLEKVEWSSDLHYVLDAIGDIAHNALDAAGEAPAPGVAEGDCEACPLDALEDPDDEPGGGSPHSN